MTDISSSAPLPDSPADAYPPDPWRDDSVQFNLADRPIKPELDTSDSALFNNHTPIHDSAKSSDNRPEPILKDVLSEFDPLAESAEEQAAHDAWGSAESHPSPATTHSPSPPSPPAKDDPSQITVSTSQSQDSAYSSTAQVHPGPSASSSSSSFPSLAAIARTFTIPSFSPKNRPHSLEVAKPIASPATLSSFAAQQEQPARADDGRSPIASRSTTPAGRGSGASSPGVGSSSSNNGNGSKATEGQFDFQKFLDQMKTKSAEPVSKYLRSFLSNFAKRTFTVHDQIKIIHDFLDFISTQMRNCDVWKNASDAEFDNAMEGMEKLVMNRLYDFTFTPQVKRAIPPRPVTTDDLERDRVLSQRLALFGWIEEKHLDIPEGEGSKGFLMFAQQELVKINHYKAPRDKLICILNSCKVIFGLLRHLKKEEGADSFVPILIYVVLKANPEHLLSNIEFISRFRKPSKLQSEAGYYLSSLMGAVSFIETMDHTSLSCISQEEFEQNVEQAIRELPPVEPLSPGIRERHVQLETPQSPHAGEESAQPLSLNAPVQALSEDAKRLLQITGDAVSKPLNAIGRIFTEALDGAENRLSNLPGPFSPFELGRDQREGLSPDGQHQRTPSALNAGDGLAPVQTPYKPRVRRGQSPSLQSPSGTPGFVGSYNGPEDSPSRRANLGPYPNQASPMAPSPSAPPLPPRIQSLADPGISRTPTPNLDFTGVQAEIDHAHEQAATAARDTLRQIFPAVDKDVVDWVLEAKEGDLGKSIEALLEMSSGT
ncbi:hypothetical protein AGABI2DRAFT_178887 [Agaricus bisporus var. bisporus H97]|uniref:hypothetical protein n=1 Tax=Agaricus bisporus var. bisporus (strain H97 / ATCC MYA-4626 / FGSC 10389) TaxID=936046 RepID=UPI00029F55C1|nr:hypothetical protein AGABI2DRAFT_178887 [Agaricus bisporus var. bisporus H97]EKV46592.1 hypothetical protein AGABI2DRAFT_178887 [Agaricus bisporus var. bisporus H97]